MQALTSLLRGAAGRFAVVGLVATVVDVGLFNALVLPGAAAPLPAKVVSTAVAAVVAFLGNRSWTFGVEQAHGTRTQVWRYVVVTVLSLLVAVLPVWVTEHVLQRHGPVTANVAANGVGLVLATCLRFVGYRQWVFAAARPAASRAAVRTAAPQRAGKGTARRRVPST